VADRAYLSIGEVLSLLKDEFADITISKIRFLESQGLLDPERTPSGYRKFYDADVDRLRWILRQQKENFLPLKVIKGRLGVEDGEGGEGAADAADLADAAGAGPSPVREPAASGSMSGPSSSGEPAYAAEPRAEAAPELRTARSDTRERAPQPAPAPIRRPVVPPPPPLTGGTAGATYTLDELARAADLSHAQVRELEGYGLLASRPVGGTAYYDDDALNVARLAAGFLNFGVEARHLRPYKSAAEREAGQFEAIVLPLLKQRNPQARQQAVERLQELANLAEGLRSALLHQALRDLAGR
jgi:DNA-binding transcriptional MerR regulator